MPQIIVCEWRIIFSENLLHKNVYPVKDPCAKRALTPWSLNVKLGPRCKGHKRRAVWLAYCLIAARPL